MNPGVSERVALVENSVSAAHARIDKVELLVAEELKEVSRAITKVNGWIAFAKGAIAAFLVVGSVIGFFLGLLAKKLFGA